MKTNSTPIGELIDLRSGYGHIRTYRRDDGTVTVSRVLNSIATIAFSFFADIPPSAADALIRYAMMKVGSLLRVDSHRLRRGPHFQNLPQRDIPMTPMDSKGPGGSSASSQNVAHAPTTRCRATGEGISGYAMAGR
jgi:hypothetical protein